MASFDNVARELLSTGLITGLTAQPTFKDAFTIHQFVGFPSQVLRALDQVVGLLEKVSSKP